MAVRGTEKTEVTKAKEAPSFNVEETCGVIGTRKNGREMLRLDFGSWNGNQGKYEIRLWKEINDEDVPTKGIGLTGPELLALRDLINALEADEPKAKEAKPKAKATSKRTTKKSTAA